jgi:hypothetical protein
VKRRAEPVNENNAMWRGYHDEMRKRSVCAGDKATLRITTLVSAGKLTAKWHTDYHVILANPVTRTSVEFFPTRGTIVRDNLRQHRRGLDVALKLIGVTE